MLFQFHLSKLLIFFISLPTCAQYLFYSLIILANSIFSFHTSPFMEIKRKQKRFCNIFPFVTVLCKILWEPLKSGLCFFFQNLDQPPGMYRCDRSALAQWSYSGMNPRHPTDRSRLVNKLTSSINISLLS